MTRRFEFVGGSSAKYWEVTVRGNDVVVHFGRLGTTGQIQTKPCGHPTAAQQHAEQLVRQKLAKGYAQVSTAVSH